jgi:membrane protein
LEGLGERLQHVFPQVSFILLYVINMALTLVVVSMIFAVIFKVLPDANIQWKAVMPGAIATAILFMIGKIGISFYISKSDMGSSFGAASSLAVIFVWIYYSSIILYFGAEFTKAYAVNKGYKVTPDKHAEWDENGRTVPGAKPKERPSFPPSAYNEVRPAPHGFPQLAIASHPIANRNLPAPAPVRDIRKEMPRGDASSSATKKPGMGTALLGLALYFITKGSDNNKGN